MSLCFTKDIPREIRDQIYTLVLASPSGVANLSPWTIEVARSLSILRASHQVRRECKDIIWAHTGLSILPLTQLTRMLEIERQLFLGPLDFRHLRICLELLDWDELDWVVNSVQPLLNSAQTGSLVSVTLSASWEKPCGLAEFKEILDLRKHGVNIDGRLLQSTYTRSNIVLNTGWPRFSHWGKQRWLREMLMDPNDTDKLLERLHRMFGGKLYVDGQMCFSDGKQIADIHGLLNPRDGEIIILPACSKDMNNTVS